MSMDIVVNLLFNSPNDFSRSSFQMNFSLFLVNLVNGLPTSKTP